MQGNVFFPLMVCKPKAKFLQSHYLLFASYWKWNANDMNVDTELWKTRLIWSGLPNQVVANLVNFLNGQEIFLRQKEMHRFSMWFSPSFLLPPLNFYLWYFHLISPSPSVWLLQNYYVCSTILLQYNVADYHRNVVVCQTKCKWCQFHMGSASNWFCLRSLYFYCCGPCTHQITDMELIRLNLKKSE